MQDDQIIDLYWQRNEQAITATASAYGTYCFQIADNILHDPLDDEECCNDTWLRAWNTIPPQKPNCLRQYLARITRNLALDRYRHQHADKRGGGEMPLVLEELAQCLSPSSCPEDFLQHQELAAYIQTFLRTLPRQKRSIFLRRYFYAEPIRQIAKHWGLSTANVSMQLSRLRCKLKKHLQQEGYV